MSLSRAELFSDWLGSSPFSFSSNFFSARKSANCYFLPPRFFFLISPAFSLYFWFTLLQIILFLYKMTNFWGEKKMELKKLYIKKKSSSVSARKLKCPGSAQNLHSSGSLEPENSSSGSSLQYLALFILAYKQQIPFKIV